MAEIPDLKRKTEEERRKGAASPWALSGSPAGSGGIFGAGSGTISRLLEGPLWWITSNVSMGIVTTLAVAGSVYGLYSLGMQSVQGVPQPKNAGFFAHRQDMPNFETTHSVPKAAGSLNYFAAANRGALDDGAPAASGQPADNSASNPSNPTPQQVPQDNAQSQPDNAGGAAGRSGFLSQLKTFSSQRLGSGNGLAGGSGMAGGMGQPFKSIEVNPNLAPGKPQQGKLVAMSGTSRPSIGRALGTGGGRSSNVKGVMGQLYHANTESGAAKKTSGEGASYHADQAFSGGPTRGGSSIGGAGIGEGGAGVGSGESGPIAPGSSSGSRAPAVGSGTDVSPWTSTVMMAMSLLMAASMLILVMSHMPEFLAPIKRLMFVIIAVLAAAAMAMGIMLMTKYGQTQQGAILTTGGAIVMAMAVTAMFRVVSPWLGVLAGIAGIGASVLSMLGRH